ncbi:MAG: hypothetical protein IJ279_04175 [Clostridia bacterium]|nr:hypothetical protein [Clostridia bacterium]
MSIDKIETPRGAIIKDKNGFAQLEWNPGFSDKWNKSYSRAQEFVDSEVLRLCSKKVPLQTSMLQKSGILGTEIGKGEVCWIAPYAKKQYYDTADSRSYDPERGGHWFERMKAEHGKAIIAKAKKIAGGG